MLTRLSVSNFAIIDELHLQLGNGLTIITGETGAGKSILLGALKLVLGERADLKQLNDPDKKCVIEASFDVSKLDLEPFFEENELDFESESILRRELLPGGRSRAFINDTPVTLDVLQKLSEQLIDIHSQFSLENLLNEKYQMQILDAYARQIPLVAQYKINFTQRSRKKNQLLELESLLHSKSQESDYKNFLLNELEETRLEPNELEQLEQEQKELQHVDEIQKILAETYTKLEVPEIGILSRINEISSAMQRISDFADDLKLISDRINSIKIELLDLQGEIQSRVSRMEMNPERLDEITERLNLLHSLMVKHRVNSIEELIEIRADLENQSTDFQILENKIAVTQQEINELENQLKSDSETISAGRKGVISQVENSLLQTLSKLGMENSSMKIELNPAKDFTPDGADEINTLFTANKGSAMKPIGKSVSGGERSRLMLAIKNLLSSHLQLPTLILDEVDTGVSGKVADEVGKLMQEMSAGMQLISITHLPQVAAKGNHHFKVLKKTEQNFTKTIVRELNSEERIMEIAELISGSDISENAIQQAKALIGA